MPPATPRQDRAAVGGRLLNLPGLVAGGAVAGLVIAAVLLWAARAPLGAQLAKAYLRSRGVPAEIVVDDLTPSRAAGRAVLGPPGDPDATVARFEATFGPAGLDAHGWRAPTLKAMRLVRPTLKARFDGARLSFGSLQPLVDAFARSKAAGPAPSVSVEAGRLRLITPAGEVGIEGDARLDQGRLANLSARAAPTTLRGGGASLILGGAKITARGQGEAISATLDADIPQAAAPGGSIAGAKLQLDLEAANAADLRPGPIHAALHLAAAQAEAGAVRLTRPAVALAFAGARPAGAPGFAVEGSATLSGDAAAATLGPARAAGLHVGAEVRRLDVRLGRGRGAASADVEIRATAPQASAAGGEVRRFDATGVAKGASLAWSKGGWSAAAPVRLAARAAAGRPLPGGRVELASLSGAMSGRVGAGPAGPRAALSGGFKARGGLSAGAARQAVQAVSAADPAAGHAVERALRDFAVDAPAVSLALGDRGWTADLRRLAVQTASGARASLALGGGLWALRVEGGGLPQLSLDVSRLRLGQDAGGFAFQLDARAKLRFSDEAVDAAEVEFTGRAERRAGALAVAAADCGRVSVGRIGPPATPAATGLAARICPAAGRPLFGLTHAGWRFDARVEGAALTRPDSQVALQDAAGLLSVSGGQAGPQGTVSDIQARLVDAAPMRRFEPLRLTGEASVAGRRIAGPLHLAEAAGGRPVAEVRFTHDLAAGAGHADIAAPRLVFAPGGLQPKDLSPIGADLVSQVDGAVGFSGSADWAAAGLSSRGRLTAAGVKFRSPFGMVSDAQADLVLTSLAPLLSAPAQPVGAAAIDWIAPLSTARAQVTLQADGVRVEQAAAELAGGQASLDPLTLPYDQTKGVAGVVRLDRIDLAVLVQRFNLADKVQIEAKLSGALPFSARAGAFRLSDGLLYAVGPGRLTVRPEALTALDSQAAAGAGANPPAMQGFAYQALQDLAFDKLEAQVASRPMGRLGVIFRIQGRHDPPKGGEVRIGVFDLLRGQALDKPLDLPKGTGVNLTLDTSLNLDELLAAYAGAAHSDAVQPAAAKP